MYFYFEKIDQGMAILSPTVGAIVKIRDAPIGQDAAPNHRKGVRLHASNGLSGRGWRGCSPAETRGRFPDQRQPQRTCDHTGATAWPSIESTGLLLHRSAISPWKVLGSFHPHPVFVPHGGL
jgi:hypothetical protein